MPVAFELIKKTESVNDKKTGKGHSPRTKNEYARDMLASVVHKQIPFRCVLSDAWFSSAENMLFIKLKAKKDCISPLRSNRRVAFSEADKKRGRWTTLSTLCTDVSGTLYPEGVPFPVVVSRQLFTNEDGSGSILCLATRDQSLSSVSLGAI